MSLSTIILYMLTKTLNLFIFEIKDTKFIIANKYLYDVIFSNFSKVVYMRLSKFIKIFLIIGMWGLTKVDDDMGL